MKSFILMVIAMVCVVSLEAQNKSFYVFRISKQPKITRNIQA